MSLLAVRVRNHLRDLVFNRAIGNPDGSVFVGPPEIRDLAKTLWTTPAAVSRVINKIARERRLKKVKAIDGVLGYEIRKDWLGLYNGQDSVR